MCTLPDKNPGVKCKVLRAGAISDIPHIPDPTVFLTDSMACLRLVRSGAENNMSVVRRMDALEMLHAFFEDVWQENDRTLVSVGTDMEDLVRYVLRMVRLQIS